MRMSYLLAGIAFAGTIASAMTDRAGAVERTCAANMIQHVNVNAAVTTSAKNFTTIPGTTTELIGVGGDNACLTVHWSAEIKAQAPQALRLRVLINGTPSGNAIDFITSSAAFEARSFTFALPGGGGGTTVALQLMSVKGGEVAVRRQNIAILYLGEF